MLCLPCSNHFSILPFYVSIYFFLFFFLTYYVCVFFFNFIFMCNKYALYMFFISYTYLNFFHILCTPSILCIYSTARFQIENKQTNKQSVIFHCTERKGSLYVQRLVQRFRGLYYLGLPQRYFVDFVYLWHTANFNTPISHHSCG